LLVCIPATGVTARHVPLQERIPHVGRPQVTEPPHLRLCRAAHAARDGKEARTLPEDAKPGDTVECCGRSYRLTFEYGALAAEEE